MRKRAFCAILSLFLTMGYVTPAGGAPTVVLDTSGFWRVHYTVSPPVVRTNGNDVPVKFPAKWLMRPTDPPAAGWMKPDFDDAAWSRFAGTAFGACSGYGYAVGDAKSPFMGRVAMRGRFRVSDPAKVKGLALSATYRGGIIVTLNGTEIARGHMGAKRPKGLANAYADGEAHDRKLAQGAIPAGVLRKGVNVLAVEVVRAPYSPKDVKAGRRGARTIDWGSCGLLSVRLRAADAAGLVSNVGRPKGLQVWNSNTMKMDTDLDWGDPNEPLRPVRIVGTRGGAFSGKVGVGSDAAMKGLAASMSVLTRRGGGSIASTSVQVRYALPQHHSAGINKRYLAPAGCLGALAETAPAEVPVRRKKPNRRIRNMTSPGVSPSFGAVCPVWVTVNVPDDAAAGAYEGTLTIKAEGATPVNVPVKLDVSGWTLPAPHEFITWADIMQSPESVAMRYGVPVWSDAHFKYLDKSLALLGSVGNKVTHLYLIGRTNAGNEQTMVRWIPKGRDGSYRYDFTPMERYLDLVEKHLVKPKVVCLYVWDTYLEGGRGGAEQYAGKSVKEARAAHKDDGPIVSVLASRPDGTRGPGGNEATGKVTQTALPKYSSPEQSLAMWKPLMAEITRRLEKRGLKGAMTLGISTDNRPTKEVVEFFKQAAPGVPWMSHGHAMPHELHGVRVAYLSGVWAGGKFAKDPSEGRTYGWQRTFAGLRSGQFSPKGGAVLVHHPRNAWVAFPISPHRLVGEMNITGQQRGFARLGADFWGVLKSRRRAQPIAARYPETSWRNLDIRSCLLAPGEGGALSTHRFEMLREGLQECEARIFIEKAILGKKIDGELAKRAQAVLDERIPAMRKGVSSLACSGAWTGHAYVDNSWWQCPGSAGSDWYTGSGWQERSKKLYEAAAEVAAALEKGR